MHKRFVPIPAPYDVVRTLAAGYMSLFDPGFRAGRSAEGRTVACCTFWTPQGPATLFAEHQDEGVLARAWGDGAEHILEIADTLLGASDQPERLTPRHPCVKQWVRKCVGLRIGWGRSIAQDLVTRVFEQRVTGKEAATSYRAFVRAFGDAAPGPKAIVGEVQLPPSVTSLKNLDLDRLRSFGVEYRRGETLRRIAHAASRIEECADLPTNEAHRRITSVQGVGDWTAWKSIGYAMGDPDAVPTGDYNLPNDVAWNFTGERRGTDEQMLELLEPYRGQRGRVLRLMEWSGAHVPRRGPRRRPWWVTPK